ncbi:hypothetical protein [Streptomyces kebangsaanensis]|uniref:hypothetical protein n=1 Tax=Streptomyces kebangsaanensis TaxID=864058 RepID=UPI0018FE4FF0|nr:hypothetical protein [Streptomyces kebangsaanensis]
MSATRAANLEAGGEAPTTFMKRVDAVPRDLDPSAGNPKRVSAQTVQRASLSGGGGVFSEAHALYEQCHAVHDKLTSLSQTPHLQIEAIGIAVQGAHRGFGNLFVFLPSDMTNSRTPTTRRPPL